MDMQKELDRILEALTAYKNDTACQGVVLGISGGKDSTVVAMLAKAVFGDKVLGVLMPNGEQKDIADSLEICKQLGLAHYVVNIREAFEGVLSAIPLEVTAQAKTNIPPRLRMTTLYAIAQTLGYRVIGTGNASESYIGWTTKWGDGAYDLNPIGSLTCTEVVALGRLLAERMGLDLSFVLKAPSDGLTGKTDEDNFGFTYRELDTYIRTGEGSEETVAKIERMHRASAHKRTMPLKF
ncbi:MAG: NAD(+) synthase [Clostridia bacterium]|nr:NAD(+) synthase [Clostridia bacterium]